MGPMPVKWYLIWTLAIMGLYITLARKNDSKDSCSTTLQDEKVYELELNWKVTGSALSRFFFSTGQKCCFYVKQTVVFRRQWLFLKCYLAYTWHGQAHRGFRRTWTSLAPNSYNMHGQDLSDVYLQMRTQGMTFCLRQLV